MSSPRPVVLPHDPPGGAVVLPPDSRRGAAPTPHDKRKSVYVAYTGGTIGMRRGPGGYEPAPGFLARQMARMPVLAEPAVPSWEIHEYEPLLDSSNMTPADWMKLARDLAENYDGFDGFIVLHGTDTMAYSASALSFLFEGLDKPILFTGSQIPLTEVRSDAYDNLITSLIIAGTSPIHEVCLFVGDRLLRGNRSTKTSAERFQAFDSPNYRPLGRAGVKIDYDEKAAWPATDGPLRLHGIEHPESGVPRVADIRLFPGITARTLERLLDAPLDGAVIHTYGAGNAPDDPRFLAVLRRATERGVVLVNCTQCLEGTVRMGTYATGSGLREAGVLSGYDMTPEAALTKLYCLLARGLETGEVRRLVEQNLRGELTRAEKTGSLSGKQPEPKAPGQV